VSRIQVGLRWISKQHILFIIILIYQNKRKSKKIRKGKTCCNDSLSVTIKIKIEIQVIWQKMEGFSKDNGYASVGS